MPEVTITHHARGDGGRYVAAVAGSEHNGHLDWEPLGENIRVATHTIVPRAIGGQGVAAKLVEGLVADARDKGFRIVPQCSYVARMFERRPEWAELHA